MVGHRRWRGFAGQAGQNSPFRSTNIVVKCAQKALGAGIGSEKLEKKEKSDRNIGKRMRKQKAFPGSSSRPHGTAGRS
jgi:hypothetical protein